VTGPWYQVHLEVRVCRKLHLTSDVRIVSLICALDNSDTVPVTVALLVRSEALITAPSESTVAISVQIGLVFVLFLFNVMKFTLVIDGDDPRLQVITK